MESSERFDVVVVGGGQAGLAAGFHLAKRNIGFVILDAYPRVGEAWRKRWSSLRLFTPARLDGLPGMPFPAPPGALPTKDEMAGYLEGYVEHHTLPVRLGIRVEALSHEGDRYVLVAGERRFEADQVIVATGGHPTPKRPDFASGLDPNIVQLHSAEYRDRSQLQEGGVLVAGAGNSGAEIAMDAAQKHKVWLAGRPTGAVSPVIYSRPLWWTANKLLTVKTRIGRNMAAMARMKGTPLVRLREKDFVAAGITRVPRVEGVESGMPRLEDGRRLDVRNVVWCTGFKHDYSWIKLPAAAGGHIPAHERGVVASQKGLYFVGLPFQFGANSALIDGVDRDAAYVTARIATLARPRTKSLEVKT
ncbi:MAG TPA: NAD(P)-binding domain-containing protein [Candidatus Dormibacteraeota bacterium]|nr:NAD(P)-binding domain-containing protein [Candidatus Dormibacteraeota bacterium]